MRGHLHENRITVLSAADGVAPRHLNKHIDYGRCCAPIPNAENATSLALPLGLAITPDGTTSVAAMGSSKIGVYSTAALESDTFVPSTADQIPVSSGGPTGLALDAGTHRLYVLTRFDNAISIINTVTRTEIGHVPMYNPEPVRVVNGRRFLYDASFTSSHGDRPAPAAMGSVMLTAWPGTSATPMPLSSQTRVPLGMPSSTSSINANRQPHVPPDEGPDGHAELARHGAPWADALAWRPHLG